MKRQYQHWVCIMLKFLPMVLHADDMQQKIRVHLHMCPQPLFCFMYTIYTNIQIYARNAQYIDKV